jgi:hypothetical protein
MVTKLLTFLNLLFLILCSQFILPGGVTVVGHVMEYVESFDILDCFNNFVKHDEAVVDVFVSLIRFS